MTAIFCSRAVRDRLELDDLLFGFSGNVVFGNVAASRKLAQKMNEARGADADPAGMCWVRSAGFEPANTRTSSVPVCQLRHERM